MTWRTASRTPSIVEEFAELRHEKGGAVDLPLKKWMRIPLRADWEPKITGKAKVFPLRIKDRTVADEVFDKLQVQGRLESTKHATLFYFRSE